MELRQLEYFMAICDELHFTRAAENLGITQPTLSQQIKALEDTMGVLLFDRIGKKIAITEAGIILQEQCRKIFLNLKSAQEQIVELQKLKRGKLIIGALPGDLSQLASKLLLEFHHKYPQVQIKILGLDDIVNLVLQNEIDLALTLMAPDDERLTKIPLYNEEFYLTIANDHPLANRDNVEFEELKDIPLVLCPINHKCRQLIDAACSSAGFEVQPIIESTDVDSILSLVKAGIGATILSRTLLTMKNDKNLKVIKIENPSICKEITIVHHKEKYIGYAARGFINLLMEYVKETKLNEAVYCENPM